MEDDSWDLQAVVRGCCGSLPGTTTESADDLSSFPPVVLQEGRGELDDLLFGLPNIFPTQAELFELEELCKPFFAFFPHHQQSLHSPQRSTSLCPTVSPMLPGGGRAALAPLPQRLARPPQQGKLPQTTKFKRRKNQQKKEVCQVPADGLSSDVWAWRKYGQKPIKGSPYPRGYYRCSSSRGCPARKQVERSQTDPGVFIVTYTAEHNHPAPTHRNSLAGSARQKIPPSTSTNSAQEVNAADGGGADAEQADCKAASCSPQSTPTAPALSPTSPLTASTEEPEEEDLLLLGDMEMLGEDDVQFLGLEELPEPSDAAAASLGDVFSEHFGAFSLPWIANNTGTAGGGS